MKDRISILEDGKEVGDIPPVFLESYTMLAGLSAVALKRTGESPELQHEIELVFEQYRANLREIAPKSTMLPVLDSLASRLVAHAR